MGRKVLSVSVLILNVVFIFTKRELCFIEDFCLLLVFYHSQRESEAVIFIFFLSCILSIFLN